MRQRLERIASVALPRWWNRLACALAGLLLIICCRSASAQVTWEYSPYEIRLWTCLENHPELSEKLGQEIAQAAVAGARTSAGYVWKVTPSPAPAVLRHDLLERIGAPAPLGADERPAMVPLESLRAIDATVLRADKLVVVAVRALSSDQTLGAEFGYQVSLRELDLPSRQWSDVLQFRSPQLEAIPSVAATGLIRIVRPIVRVERVEGKSIVARIRGGGLITSTNSPAMVKPGQILQPVVRRNGKNGEPLPGGGIYAPAWSYLTVDSQEDTSIGATLYSGYGNVIPAKGGARTERLAIGVRPQYTTTRLELRARQQPTSPGRPAAGRPLAGYEVYAKIPGEENSTLVGLTDFAGGIDLAAKDHPLKLFYIKNGGQMLARLPLVVGHMPSATALVLDDDPRLQAETFVKAMQSRVMDIVARREILAVRIRSKLKKGDVAAARSLVEEFRALPTRSDLTRELEERQRRTTGTTGVTAKRIEKLFDEGHRLLAKFLDPAVVDVLAREVAEAEKKSPVPASSTTSSQTS